EVSGLVRMLGVLTLAVHVTGEGNVTQASQLLGPLARVFVQPPPLMYYQHARTLALGGIVPGEMPLEIHAAVLVGEAPRLPLGADRGANRHDPRQRQQPVAPHDSCSFTRRQSVEVASLST